MIAVLTGGTGGAKFVDGLRKVVPAEELTIIVNTGDDLKWWGLSISPDIDSILYVLANLLSQERGWGFKNDTFFCLQTMADLQEEDWFKIGDRDLAVHLLRTRLLMEGKSLTQATSEIAARLKIKSQVLPMSDDQVETRILTSSGELSFEEYFVKRRFRDDVLSVRFAGAEPAAPASGTVEAILAADAILLAPSNPITSIGPILAIKEIRQALRSTSAQVVAVSPIIGDAAVSGPAANLMKSQGLPVSIAGIATAYEDFLDLLIVDLADEERGKHLERDGLRVYATNTIMRTDADKIKLARQALSQTEVRTQSAIR